jgi:hypothetical protein
MAMHEASRDDLFCSHSAVRLTTCLHLTILLVLLAVSLLVLCVVVRPFMHMGMLLLLARLHVLYVRMKATPRAATSLHCFNQLKKWKKYCSWPQNII